MKAQRELYCPRVEAGETYFNGALSVIFQLKAKTPWSFTATCRCGMSLNV
jgi:hypothetical protein